MLKVLYDHQAFDMQMYGGVSNRAVQLISNLSDDIEVKIGVKKSQNIHLLESHLGEFKVPFLYSFERLLNGKHYLGKNLLHFKLQTYLQKINRKYSIDLLKNGDFDIFHPTFFDYYFLNYLQSKPFVMTIHDLTAEYYFDRNDLQVVFRKELVGRASHIVANSEYTKNQITEYYHVPEKKISVIYCGGPSLHVCQKKKTHAHEYILYVGDRCSKYKNFQPMLVSLKPFLLTHKNIRLVCTGKPFNNEECMLIDNLELSDYVIHKACSDDDLKRLYSNAMCFIYPSLNEGFGMPILEAYSMDCPVFLINKSCFPEVAGGAAIFFELDNDGGDLSEKLEDFLKWTKEQKDDLIKKQRMRLDFFSWKKFAQELREIYRSLI